ncbi:MAG: DUF4422 domain-containing protein [archaeon]|nr:DUF4422 domain-containing protein [archaeon]
MSQLKIIYLFVFLLLFFTETVNSKKKVKKYKVNIFICTHKDLIPLVTSQAYKIVADDKNTTKYNYPLEVIYADKGNDLYKMRVSYSEGSKMYHIWKNYRPLPKYVGFDHYSKYFAFYDKIPDMDLIFKNYDVILREVCNKTYTIMQYFDNQIYKPALEEVIDIIRELYPEYYETAKKEFYGKRFYWQNMFVMKREDFLKYGEFTFGVLKEFDRRHNLTSPEKLKEWVFNEWPNYLGQRTIRNWERFDGYLLEHISQVFYIKHFNRILDYKVDFPRKDSVSAKSQSDIIFPNNTDFDDNDPNVYYEEIEEDEDKEKTEEPKKEEPKKEESKKQEESKKEEKKEEKSEDDPFKEEKIDDEPIAKEKTEISEDAEPIKEEELIKEDPQKEIKNKPHEEIIQKVDIKDPHVGFIFILLIIIIILVITVGILLIKLVRNSFNIFKVSNKPIKIPTDTKIEMAENSEKNNESTSLNE